ncbi:hypothetical protein OpiT1DRAFT_04004 [Opitutaceae bacterium TAV1]|nr:hypothetical protein OpiT1DRAFT_04004 [Opitutaceae bacterium TAV1]
MESSPVTIPVHEQIDALALRYSKCRDTLAAVCTALETDVRLAHAKHKRNLDTALANAAQAADDLRAEVEAHPELFVKPRTWTLHRIKFGFQRGKPKLEWEDDAEVVTRIKEIYGEHATELLHVEESPNAGALAALSEEDLLLLGITVQGGKNGVLVKAVETSTDKLVKRLLKEGTRDKTGDAGEDDAE